MSNSNRSDSSQRQLQPNRSDHQPRSKQPSRSQQPQPNKKYQPQFNQTIPLPSIKQFRLNYILNHELKDESQQVISDLLAVSTNYRKDLKNEIRSKLSIEQRLQNKNIEIAKLAGKLDKSVKSQIKSVSKIIYPNGDTSNVLDTEVLTIFELSDTITGDFKRIANSLYEIEESLNSKNAKFETKYPLLNEYFNRSKRDTRSDQSNNVNDILSPQTVQNDDVPKSPKRDEPTESPENNNISPQSITNDDMFNSIIQYPYEKLPNPYSTKTQTEINEMDAETFEKFMSQTLNNYRKVQSERYDAFNVFLEDESERLDTIELFNNPHFDNSLSSTFHKSENPVDLLYVKPRISSSSSMEPSAKAPPTVDQTFLTSHFKKLRINGSPITSGFGKNGVGIAGGSEGKTDGRYSEGIDVLRSFSNTNSDGSSFSPVISTEEEISDNILSSGSSDSDSSLEDTPITGNPEEYYKSLKKDLKIKKKLSRHKLRTRTSYFRQRSPSAKHEPSHHILKPKGSILKGGNLNFTNGNSNTNTFGNIAGQSGKSIGITTENPSVNTTENSNMNTTENINVNTTENNGKPTGNSGHLQGNTTKHQVIIEEFSDSDSSDFSLPGPKVPSTSSYSNGVENFTAQGIILREDENLPDDESSAEEDIIEWDGRHDIVEEQTKALDKLRSYVS